MNDRRQMIMRVTISGKDQKLTKFEWRVYRAVCKIPLGETRSYEWVAKRVGSPRSARAVGNALRKNPYPLLIPCHRVVNSDGSLGGYSQGIEKKKKLLALEKALAGLSVL